jgi:MFS transporter, DHA1 family, inner membrane transport protein
VTLQQPSNQDLSRGQLLALSVGTFTLGLDAFVLSGLLPQVAVGLRVTVPVAAQLTTIFAITYAVTSPIIATVTGRLDRRTVILVGMAIFLLGMVCQALGPTFVVVGIGRVLAGVGAAAFQANAYAVAGIRSSDARRPRNLAAVSAGSMVSAVVGVPFGVLLGQAWGWRGAMWLIAGLALASAALSLLLPPTFAPTSSLRERLRVLVKPRLLVVLLSTVLVVMPSYLALAFLPVIAAPVDAPLTLVVILVCMGLGQLIGNRLVGPIVERRGALSSLLLGMLGAVLGFGGLAASIGLGSLGGVMVSVFAIGVFSGISFTAQQSRLFPAAPEAPTVALGLGGSAIYVGAALGAGAGGVITAVAGARWLPLAATGLCAIAVIAVYAVAPDRAASTKAVPGAG